MAEASRIFHTTLISNFSTLTQKSPSSRSQLTSHPRRITVRCSISTTGDTVKTAANRTIPWGCDIDSLENASALQKWLSELGLPPQKMGIQRVEVGERGLVALKNIRKGEKLLFVPPSLAITADSVRIVRWFLDFFG